MATSKYGVGKYGARLYSAIPFVNYAAGGSVVVSASGPLIAEYELSASGKIELSAFARYDRVRTYSAVGFINISAIGTLWEAFTVNFSASGEVVVSAKGLLGLRPEFSASGAVVISAVGSAYFGKFWNENKCAPDVWDKESAPVSPWVNANCPANTWNESTDG